MYDPIIVDFSNTMECMACSDNVVRAGLTPKYRDVHTLCEMLDYTGKPANKTKFPGKSVTENGVTITTFGPPIRDFAVKKFEVNVNMQALFVVDVLLPDNFDTEICSWIYNQAYWS